MLCVISTIFKLWQAIQQGECYCKIFAPQVHAKQLSEASPQALGLFPQRRRPHPPLLSQKLGVEDLTPSPDGLIVDVKYVNHF